MKSIYNFATIEVGEIFRGPGQVIGVIAVAVDPLNVELRFRDESAICDYAEKIRTEIDRKTNAAIEAGMGGKELLRAIAAPRQSNIQYVIRGTRYCENGHEEEMMDILFERYTGAERFPF